MIKGVEFILYVADQAKSTEFYTKFLNMGPSLNVPGMSEFMLPNGAILGLMPIAGIQRLLDESLLKADWSRTTPRCEIYLTVSDAEAWMERAIGAGGRKLSDVAERSWGHRVGYVADLDFNIIAVGQIIGD